MKPYQGRFAVFGPVHPVDGGDYAPLAIYNDEHEAILSEAAPELLEACKAVLRCIDDGNSASDAQEELRAAIAKAERRES